MVAKLVFIFLIVLTGASLANPVYADDLDRAKTLLKQDKPEQAYQYLTNEAADHIGEPDYDMLLARCALKAKHPHKAIFAYERVLMINPANNAARTELAVAYFRTNELETAREHFNRVLANKPSDEIKTIATRYLEQINEKIDARRHSLTGVLTLKQGWDDNINNATNESSIDLTIGTYHPTAGVDKQTADTFTEVINRLKYDYHFNVNSEFFSSLGYSNRDNNNKGFDRQSADTKFGYSQNTPIGKLSVPLSYQAMWLGEKRLLGIAALSTGLNQTYGDLFTDYNLQYGQIRYPYQHSLDMDYFAGNVVLGTSDSQATVNQQYVLFYGDESPTNDLYQFNARRYRGAQIRLPIRLTAHHYLTPRMIYQFAEYKAKHPFFTQRREDKYYSAELDWNWYFNRKWFLTTQLSHTASDSTVALYTYTRNSTFVGINLRY